ncbi:nitrate reductase subunit alpha [Acidithiobacillus ferrooxidans F221]|uniref:nitrate reductase subunit alpha n=1 Tax=Acidithiobacillus ferrooxidans TaxID=920 RepID=UPI001C073FE6|nr:nitrate reductase subunit alpha [Acidithiobacillus ferrooxidans]MBU2808155.1 nitrate reductase subunit alpha [Acidithiobacillus ferrooxidans F221]
MSHLLDRLKFLVRHQESFSNGHGIKLQDDRLWEDAYRHRWRYDKVVRTTHGVNCTGGCSWNVHVKNGLVVFEMQAHDYPQTRPDLPNHEPRGCQRGASFSWYLYSPHRIKHPMIRGRLLDLYRQEKAAGKDPVEAWRAIQENPHKRSSYVAVRGLGGFVRSSWDEVNEIIAAANIYTILRYGPDRIAGFSVIPAMSMISYAAGTRYLSLIGGVPLSFYDWYCDLPPSSPQVWGEQTDVPESADWYNSTYIIVAGTNIPATRTPDAHFYSEVRYKGTKVVAVAPDYAEYVKFADEWLPVRAGTDAALFLAMGHVVLQEFFLQKQILYFQDYARRFTDLPMQLLLRPLDDGCYASDRFLRASDFADQQGQEEHPEWKTIVYDECTQSYRCPKGSIGFRWDKTEGKWNLLSEDAATGEEIKPELSCLGQQDAVLSVVFPDYGSSDGEAHLIERKVPARRLQCVSGEQLICSVFDLLLAQYGVNRAEVEGNVDADYGDAHRLFTPAWQEGITGIPQADCARIAHEFAENAVLTQGKSMVIVGAGTNHWYHNDMNYRAIINLVHLCGCVGQSGGGWAHYVGQEALRPQAGWLPLAFASDWHPHTRQAAGTSYWYLHTDQWRYERVTADSLMHPAAKARYRGHTLADYNVVAERLGWLPAAPHFQHNPLDIAKAAEQAGAQNAQDVADYVVDELQSGRLSFASEDVDHPNNWPRNLFVWRSNLIGTNAKGHEYFLKHLLGAENAVLGKDDAGAASQEIRWREKTPVGKLDLMVDINFRLNSTGAYSDIILPTATWYEKDDLNTTDMHPFIHPLGAAVDPGWESRSDWQIFRHLAKSFSVLAEKHLGTRKDLLALALLHDSPGELGQAVGVSDWKRDGQRPKPGRTCPHLEIVERDYPRVYEQYSSIGPLLAKHGNGAKGERWETGQEISELLAINGIFPSTDKKDAPRPSLETDINACNMVLHLSPETNGEVAHKGWGSLGKKTGLSLTGLSADRRGEKFSFHDLQVQPRKVISSPSWSGLMSEEVSYNAGYVNVHYATPYRTLTGRGQFYLDHEWMLDFGEGLCTYRPPLTTHAVAGLPGDIAQQGGIVLRFLTPHDKWGIHSTYHDDLRMMHLSRGGPHIWISEKDAKRLGVSDNDWLESVNENGALMACAVVSQRIPEGVAIMYHQQEKTLNVPGAPSTGKRGGINNSATRVIPKPTHMIGGYAQLAWTLNYYGPVGSQRDAEVLIRKVSDERISWLEKPLSEALEKELRQAVEGIL